MSRGRVAGRVHFMRRDNTQFSIFLRISKSSDCVEISQYYWYIDGKSWNRNYFVKLYFRGSDMMICGDRCKSAIYNNLEIFWFMLTYVTLHINNQHINSNAFGNYKVYHFYDQGAGWDREHFIILWDRGNTQFSNCMRNFKIICFFIQFYSIIDTFSSEIYNI